MIDTAARAGARLVVMDNLTRYGRSDGRPLDEGTPVAPISGKDEARADAARTLLTAHRAGTAQVVIGHASDLQGAEGGKTRCGDACWPAAPRAC
jgi:hypothetical protein